MIIHTVCLIAIYRSLVFTCISRSVNQYWDTLCQSFIFLYRVSDPHFFFADPDPGKNLQADPDPDPGGIRGRGLGVKGKINFFGVFFTFQMILNNGCLKSEQKK